MKSLEERITEEFPWQKEKIQNLFKKSDFLNILNFLDQNKFFGIDPGKAKLALREGRTKELFELATRNEAKEDRVRQLFMECAQLWGKQIGAFC